MTAFMLLSFVPSQSKAATESNTETVVSTTASDAAKDNADLARLNEIKAMDMSTLSRSEKKELRKEVREIKNDQDGYRRHREGHGDGNYNGRHNGGTIYFMGGGGLLVLILILLLI